MAIHDHFDKRWKVFRLRIVSGNKKSFQSTGTIDLHAQNRADDYNNISYGAYETPFKIWFDIAETIPKVGMAIQDLETGDNFEIVSVFVKDHGGIEYREALLKQILEKTTS